MVRSLKIAHLADTHIGMENYGRINPETGLNQRMHDEGLPVQIANISSIWSVFFAQPSRYNWMFQYYLRAEGLALSWTGTGRIIFSLNYTDADFEAVTNRYMAAGKAMQQDGWWWSDPLATNKSIKRRIQREMIAHRFIRNHHAS